MYENPRTLFQQKISNIIYKDKNISSMFEDIFKLQQIYALSRLVPNSQKEEDWKVLLEILDSLGSVNFSKLISIIKGRTLSFPDEEELQEAIITTLCYYYKEIERKEWDQIKECLNMKDLNTIKYGIKVTQFKQFIQTQALKDLK